MFTQLLKLQTQYWSSIVLIEMIARVIKDITNELLRLNMKTCHTGDGPHKRIILHELNSAFGNLSSSNFYWKVKIMDNLIRKFPLSKKEEFSNAYSEFSHSSIRDHVFNIQINYENGKYLLLKRISKLLGIHFRSNIWNLFQLNSSSTTIQFRNPFLETDIKQLKESIKYVHIINHSNGFVYKMKAMESTAKEETNRFYNLAIKFFEKALSSFPNNKDSLVNIADCYSSLEINQKASDYYKKALEEGKDDPTVLYKYGAFLEKIGKSTEAEEMYLAALSANSSHSNCCVIFADFLASHKKEYDRAERYYEMAIQSNRNNKTAYNNYGIFLAVIRNNKEKANAIFKEGLDIPSKKRSLIHVQNYVTFLKYIMGDLQNSEKYRKELDATSKNKK